MAKQSTSGWGVFGSFIVAIGIVVGFFYQSIYTAVVGVTAGLFFLILSSVIERLDTIIDLLKILTSDKKNSKDSNNKSNDA